VGSEMCIRDSLYRDAVEAHEKIDLARYARQIPSMDELVTLQDGLMIGLKGVIYTQKPSGTGSGFFFGKAQPDRRLAGEVVLTPKKQEEPEMDRRTVNRNLHP